VALRERLLAAAPSRRQGAVLGLLAAALAALVALVAVGALTGLDQYSLDHLMPWLDPRRHEQDGFGGYWRPFSPATTTGAKLLALFAYPASLLVSALVVLGAASHLWRRGLRVAALAPAAAWLLGNGVEWAGKHTLTRPALYGGPPPVRIHVASFDDSFPSGHTLRAIIVAYTVIAVFALRPRWPVALWAAAVAPVLVLSAAHTPSDVIGGALIGAQLVVLLRAALRSELAGAER
jgi:undecaprenyl-diphosphatase